MDGWKKALSAAVAGLALVGFSAGAEARHGHGGHFHAHFRHGGYGHWHGHRGWGGWGWGPAIGFYAPYGYAYYDDYPYDDYYYYRRYRRYY